MNGRVLMLAMCFACTPDGVSTVRYPVPVASGWSNPEPAVDTDEDPNRTAITLTAAAQTYIIDGEEIEGYAYNGQNPGPTIRLTVGDTLSVTLVNDLDVPTTIHWHGLSVPYAMDGVTWTNAPIGPGESFEYTFTVTQTGTFWYHPHFDTERQVDLGLYGLIIVEEEEEPSVDRELNLVMDSWGDYHSDSTHQHFGAIRAWTVNGLKQPDIDVASGDLIRMRILNASNIGYLSLSGSFRVIASDQGWLSQPHEGEGTVLGPGDRIEAEWRVGSQQMHLMTYPYAMHGGGAYGVPIALATLSPIGLASAPPEYSWPQRDGDVSEDPGVTDLVYVFQGDDSSGVWMINGEVFPDITIHQLPMDTTAIIEVRNMSSVEHPFHLHGFSFEVLSVNGEPSSVLRIEDTLNLSIRDRVRLKVMVDNPGFWMTHCHILPHAYGGMMTIIEVPEPSEP